MVQQFGGSSKSETELPYDPAMPTVRVYAKEFKAGFLKGYLYSAPLFAIAKEVAATQMSMDR